MISPPEIQVEAGRFYTVKKTAAALGLDRRTVAKMILKGQLNAIEIGDREMIPGAALLTFLAMAGGAK